MTLIKSISGIRGTIGGIPGEGLTPLDVVKIVSGFARIMKNQKEVGGVKLVIGRDGRTTGAALNRLVCGTLQLSGIEVIDLGLSTTPSVAMAVTWHKAHGGIILTASHNPAEWNALKLLNSDGEFISDEEGKMVLEESENKQIIYPKASETGDYITDYQSIERHIDAILESPLIDTGAIRSAGFRVAFDGINSTGGIALPLLLRELGVNEVFPLNEEPNGVFAHHPEPLPENLQQIIHHVLKIKADVGFVVDPDVDRLAIVCEDGSLFGEEYTLVAVADYILGETPGNTVSNLSSTRALEEITSGHGGTYAASAVGEVNVVAAMKKTGAVIGGEGNGGVIWPYLHYGRDALAGIALFLTHLAKSELTCSALRRKYPFYPMLKHKIVLPKSFSFESSFEEVIKAFPDASINTTDGMKLDLPDGWVHLRKSNTEPIVRIYAEAISEDLAHKMIRKVSEILQYKIKEQ